MSKTDLELRAEKRAKIDALVKKFKGKVKISQNGPLAYDKSKEDSDYQYILPSSQEQSSWEGIGAEVVTDQDIELGDNSVSKPAQMGTAREVKYRSAHHVLMRIPHELYAEYKQGFTDKNIANENLIRRKSPDPLLTHKYTETPD